MAGLTSHLLSMRGPYLLHNLNENICMGLYKLSQMLQTTMARMKFSDRFEREHKLSSFIRKEIWDVYSNVKRMSSNMHVKLYMSCI